MDEWVESMAEAACLALESDGHLVPVMLSHRDGAVVAAVMNELPYESKVKHATMLTAAGLARAFGTNHVLAVNDAWVSYVPKQENGEFPDLDDRPEPRNDPDRREMLMLVDAKAGKVSHWMRGYHREGDQIVWDEDWVRQETDDKVTGAVTDLMVKATTLPEPSDEVVATLAMLATQYHIDVFQSSSPSPL